jgi:HK97 gp10 family phage protein
MTKEFQVKGLADLNKFLNALPEKMKNNVLRGALGNGAKVVRNKARQNIHHVSGELAAGLRVSTRVKDNAVIARVVARGDRGFVAKFVEYGTRPHLISVRDSEKRINYKQSFKQGKTIYESMTTINRRSLEIGNKFVGPTVSHPGATSNNPFLRPALDSEAGRAVLAVGNYIKNRLAKKNGLDTSGIELSIEE